MSRNVAHRKLLLWIGAPIGLLLLVIAVVAIYLGTRSDEWWRDQLTATLSQTLGREVEIQGAFRLDFGRRFTTEAASVRIGNPEWAETRDMLRLGSLLLEFDLLSVLGDTILIHQLELADIELALEESQNGEQNWDFGFETEAKPPTAKPDKAVTLPVQIEQVSVQQAQFSFVEPSREQPLVLQLDSVTGGQNLDDQAVLDASGQLGKLPFKLKGSLGKISDALNAGPVSYQLSGNFAKLQLQADISAANLTSTTDMDVTLRLSGENLAAVADLLGLPPLPKGAFALDAVLQRDNSMTRIDKMIASVGKHQISVGGVVGVWPELKDTRLELKAEGPNLAAFTPTVTQLGLGQLPPGAYSANTLMESSDIGLHVLPSKVNAGGYQATAEGHITTKEQVRVELNVTGSGPDLSMITRLADIIQLPALPFEASGRIDITGDDITLIGTSGTAGKNKVAVDGPIAFSTEGPVRLDVKGSGPSLQAVLQGLGYDVIPAAAAYQVEGKVEFADNQVVVTAKHARLGPAEASATLSIPDLNTPTILAVEVGKLKTSDVSAALALVGTKLELPQVMPANLSGQIKRTKDATGLSKVHGSVGSASVKVDGTIGDPPKYKNTRMSLDISGPNLERFLPYPIEQALPFQLKGRVVSAKEYTRLEDLQLKLANIEARANGQVGSWDSIAGTELTLSAQGPNLDAVAAVLNLPLPAGALKFDGHVRGAENAFHIDRMSVQLGRSNLSGDLKLTRGKPPLLKGTVSSHYLDASLLKKEIEAEKTSASSKDMPQTNEEREADATEVGAVPPQQKLQRLFPNSPIELKAFDKLDLDLDVRIDELVNLSERGVLHDISAKVLLKERDLTVSNFQGHGPLDSKLTGNLSINHDAELTRIAVDFTGKQLRVGLAAAPDQEPATYPPSDVEAKLIGAGSTYHNLAASLDGRIKVIQGEGRINNSSVAVFLSDILYELFQSVNPLAKAEPTTRLDCGVYIVNLADGIADIQAFVAQTDKLTIVSAGKIDLNTEQLDVGFNTRPRKGVGISVSTITNSYIKLGGTLAKPAIALDAGSATVATGAAVATGGLSFLFKGVWDRYFSARDPCGEALKTDAELQDKKAKQQSGKSAAE